MSKKIKVKILDSEKLIFELEEDAKKGDIVDLGEFEEFNFSTLRKDIANKKDELFNEQLEKEKKTWLVEFKGTGEYKTLEEKVLTLEKDKEFLNASMNSKITEASQKKELELTNKYNEKINNLKLEIENKINEINNIKNEIETTKKTIALEVENRFNEKINKLNADIASKNSEIEINNIKKMSEIEKVSNDIKSEYEKKIIMLENTHKDKILDMERQRKTTTKILGEELETFIYNEYQSYFGILDDCSLSKTTKDIEGSKPDFLFKVFDKKDNRVLGSVTIEAKTQQSVSQTSIKNKDHFNKLEKDRIAHQSEFSLLISELEPNNDFLITKVNEGNYQNMFIVRPSYFIPFLSLIRFLLIERSKINTLAINFKKKEEIAKEFEALKEDILNKSLKNIDNKMLSIIKKAEDISKAAETILDDARTVLDKHLETVKSKIQSFKIKRIYKKLEQFDSGENPNDDLSEINDIDE